MSKKAKQTNHTPTLKEEEIVESKKTSSCSKFLFFLVCFLIRLLLVIVGELLDKYSTHMKYTDIDYSVFSDAATHVYRGDSPYKRHTYRYTPLAAYICLVNNYIHPVCGKLVFISCDIVMGLILWRIFEAMKIVKADRVKWYVGGWMLNPLVINLSTRGSNDNIISLLVFIAVYYLLKKQYVLSAIFYGLSVHFKIYPIIYSIPFYLFIDADFGLIQQGKRWEAFKRSIISWNKIKFTIISAGTFIGLTYYFYTLYGHEFLYETYLYHFERKDHRHNFSIYFYLIYQLYEQPTGTFLAILTFVPQWGLVLISALFLYYDLFFCMFLQTLAFVVFNKVCTAQYFIWYITLFPLILTNSKLALKKAMLVLLVALFIVIDASWGYFAWQFEFGGQQTIKEMHYVNVVFFWYFIFAFYQIITNQTLTITRHIISTGIKEKSE